MKDKPLCCDTKLLFGLKAKRNVKMIINVARWKE